MGTIIGLTEARLLEIEAGAIVSGAIVSGELILTTFGGLDINAGVVTPQGAPTGGVAGQTIVKQSSTDFDLAWATLTADIISETDAFKIMTAAERTSIATILSDIDSKQEHLVGVSSKVLITQSPGGDIVAAAATSGELEHLIGVTSGVQTQIQSKQDALLSVFDSGHTTGAYVIDHSIRNGYLVTIGPLTGNVSFSAANIQSGFQQRIRIVNGATLRTLSFPSYTFVGGAAPANIAANKTGLLTLTTYSSVASSVLAKWEVQP